MGPSLQSPLWVVLPRRSFPQAANSGVNAAWPKSAAEHNQPEANWSIAEATNLRIWRKKWDLNSHAYYSQRFSRPRPLALLGLFFLIVVGVVGVEPTRFHRGVTVPSLTIREHTHGSLTWVRTRDQQSAALPTELSRSNITFIRCWEVVSMPTIGLIPWGWLSLHRINTWDTPPQMGLSWTPVKCSNAAINSNNGIRTHDPSV